MQPFNLTAGILFIATCGGLWAYFTYEKERLARKRIAEQTKGIGKPKVGGPFQLVDQNGKVFSNEDMLGKYSLVRRDPCGGALNSCSNQICRSTLASPTARTFAPTNSTKWPSCTTKSSRNAATSSFP